jgi:hypothetical protein
VRLTGCQMRRKCNELNSCHASGIIGVSLRHPYTLLTRHDHHLPADPVASLFVLSSNAHAATAQQLRHTCTPSRQQPNSPRSHMRHTGLIPQGPST